MLNSIGNMALVRCREVVRFSEGPLSLRLDCIHNYNVVLGGGVACLLFWTIVHTACLFYCCDGSADHNRLQTNRDAEHSQPIAHAQQNLHGQSDIYHYCSLQFRSWAASATTLRQAPGIGNSSTSTGG